MSFGITPIVSGALVSGVGVGVAGVAAGVSVGAPCFGVSDGAGVGGVAAGIVGDLLETVGEGVAVDVELAGGFYM